MYDYMGIISFLNDLVNEPSNGRSRAEDPQVADVLYDSMS